jgi:DNA-binding NtrC family response regulator
LLSDIMAAVMEEVDAKVTIVLNGTLAVPLIENQRFDMALINASFPAGPSGVELARLAVNRTIPVLLISGDPGVSAQLKDAGYHYLQKPFTVESLLDETRRALHDPHENIRRLRASGAKAETNLNRLLADIAGSRRLWDEVASKLSDRCV